MEKITLKYPITVDGVKTDTLQLRRPIVKDMISMEKTEQSSAEKEVHLFANLCAIPFDSLLNADMADYTQLQQAYQDFLS